MEERFSIANGSLLSVRFDVEQWFTEANSSNPVSIYGQREDDLGKSMLASHFDTIFDDSGWIYSVTVKTQAVLPVQTTLRGKILLSIYGEVTSLDDAVLASDEHVLAAFHAGGEHLVELKSSRRLGEVVFSYRSVMKRTSFSLNRSSRLTSLLK